MNSFMSLRTVVYEFVVEIKEGVVPSVLEANREVYEKY
jgi:hypothetical protein